MSNLCILEGCIDRHCRTYNAFNDVWFLVSLVLSADSAEELVDVANYFLHVSASLPLEFFHGLN